MKKLATVVLVISLFGAVPVLLSAQGGRGRMAGGMSGAGMRHGRTAGPGPGSASCPNQGMNGRQTPLKQSQIRSGSFRMLQQKTGMSESELQHKYASSGAHDFGQFASAMVVSKNLGLNSDQVLSGMQTQGLGKTLQNMGVSKGDATREMERARNEIREANRNGN